MNKYHFSLHIFFKQDCDVNELEKIIGIKAYKKVLLKDSVGHNKSAKLWLRTEQETLPNTVERLSKFIEKMQPTFLLLQGYLKKFDGRCTLTLYFDELDQKPYISLPVDSLKILAENNIKFDVDFCV